jgi:hypothetical protein
MTNKTISRFPRILISGSRRNIKNDSSKNDSAISLMIIVLTLKFALRTTSLIFGKPQGFFSAKLFGNKALDPGLSQEYCVPIWL